MSLFIRGFKTKAGFIPPWLLSINWPFLNSTCKMDLAYSGNLLNLVKSHENGLKMLSTFLIFWKKRHVVKKCVCV